MKFKEYKINVSNGKYTDFLRYDYWAVNFKTKYLLCWHNNWTKFFEILKINKNLQQNVSTKSFDMYNFVAKINELHYVYQKSI